MLQHGRKEICGVSLAWVGDDEQWISCKELKDRRLHHVDDVEKRAHDLNLRLRHSNTDEHYLFRKMGAGARSACKASLLHIDDVYVLIESCQSFPQILNESLNLFFKQKRKPGPKPGSKFNRRKTKEKVNRKTIFNDKIAIKRSTSLTDISTEAKKPRLTSHSEPQGLKRSQSCPIITAESLTALTIQSPLPIKSSNPPCTTQQSAQQSKRIRRTRMIIPIDSDYDDTDDEILNNLAQINMLEQNQQEKEKPLIMTEEKCTEKTKKPTPGADSSDSIQRPQRKIPTRLGDSFQTRAAWAERKQTAIVNKLVREAKKVAKKKKKVEHRARAKSHMIVKAFCTKPKLPESPKSADSSVTNDSKKSPRGRGPNRIKTDAMKDPHLTISPTGVICFSDQVKEKVGLLSKLRREERERQKKAREELAELAKLAKEILIQEQKEKQVKEKLKKQAEKEAKLAEREVKKSEKEAEKQARAALREQREAEKQKKRLEIEMTKKETKAALRAALKAQQQQSMQKPLPKPKPPPPTHSRSTRAATSAINCPPLPGTDGQAAAENGQAVSGEKRKSLTNGELTTKERKRSKCNGRMAPPTQNDLPPPVLGTVTFLAGDKIIRRSPRKLPEAAKAAIDPATGMIPYSFACTVGNTQGVIPHGLTEKHFISYRPAKKRASNHWCEELLQSLEVQSGRDSGLDSNEEEAIRIMISSKKRENKRKISRSPKKREPSPVNQKRLKKQASSDNSSGDSGRETPTTVEIKEISLKSLIPPPSNMADLSQVTNLIDSRQLCIQSFCLTGFDYSCP